MNDMINKDNRILYDVGVYKYTVSDVDKIYQECKADIDKCDTGDLKFLYDSFQIKQKHKLILSRSEILQAFSEMIAIIARSGDIENIRTEVRKCRRKFFYWRNLPTHIYFINEKLDNYNTNKRLKADIDVNKDYYDSWIAYACYSILIDNVVANNEGIEDDKLYRHKLDWEYARALKYFSGEYEISDDLEISTDDIFYNIYCKILKYGEISFYERIYTELYKEFDRTEKRIRINNEQNTELPTLLIYSIRAMSESNERDEADVKDTGCPADENIFQQILSDTKYAIRLLDVNNEHDLEFLLPGNESIYLERIMKYSAVYDIHQYVPEGMLFLIHRIIDAYNKQLEEYYNCECENLKKIINRRVRSAQCDFEAGIISKVPFISVSDDERNILDQMVAPNSLNSEYYTPTQWDKVYSDSEWIIKKQDAYYVIPPIVSMLGVYDKIGKALGWADFGPQIEKAVFDLFQEINNLEYYSGKYLFDNQVYECDAIIKGTEYALIIECKRKGISRAARGGTDVSIIKDIAETYFSSQSQAYRMHRAIEVLGRQVGFYPSEYTISAKESYNSEYEKYKKMADFTTIKHFVRISCTGGSFWIAAEGGIADHIENHIKEYKVDEKINKVYIGEFISERDKLLELKCCERYKRIIKLDRLFLSFDKLYDIVMASPKLKEGGDALLKEIWNLTRVYSKKNDSVNHLAMFMSLNNR